MRGHPTVSTDKRRKRSDRRRYAGKGVGRLTDKKGMKGEVAITRLQISSYICKPHDDLAWSSDHRQRCHTLTPRFASLQCSSFLVLAPTSYGLNRLRDGVDMTGICYSLLVGNSGMTCPRPAPQNTHMALTPGGCGPAHAEGDHGELEGGCDELEPPPPDDAYNRASSTPSQPEPGVSSIHSLGRCH